MTTHTASTKTTNGKGADVSDAGSELLAKYVGDMAALETHIEEALDRQLDVSKDDPVSGKHIQEFHDMVKGQRDKMIELRDSLGSNAANPIKEIGGDILGKAAGLIDKVRADARSKSLRDDYAAFSLAAISYSMLFTTAKGVGSSEVATAAENGLKNYARAIQKINHLMPDVVLSELADEDGIEVVQGVAKDVRAMVDKAWKSTEQSGMQNK